MHLARERNAALAQQQVVQINEFKTSALNYSVLPLYKALITIYARERQTTAISTPALLCYSLDFKGVSSDESPTSDKGNGHG